MRRLALAAAALAAAAALLACRLDPVPQEVIDGLGPEQGTPNEGHRAGQPCVLCHGGYGTAAPQMAFGGTVYTTDDDGNIIPAGGVEIVVFGAAGDQRKACSNSVGNFYLKREDWKEIAYPLKVRAGSRAMTSLIGRDGSCGACHKPPSPNFPDRDPLTGADRDSAGYILVNPSDTDRCP